MYWEWKREREKKKAVSARYYLCKGGIDETMRGAAVVASAAAAAVAVVYRGRS